MHSAGMLSNKIHSRSRVNEHNSNELALNHLSLMHVHVPTIVQENP